VFLAALHPVRAARRFLCGVVVAVFSFSSWGLQSADFDNFITRQRFQRLVGSMAWKTCTGNYYKMCRNSGKFGLNCAHVYVLQCKCHQNDHSE